MWVVTQVESSYETTQIIGPFETFAEAEAYAKRFEGGKRYPWSHEYGVEPLVPPGVREEA